MTHPINVPLPRRLPGVRLTRLNDGGVLMDVLDREVCLNPTALAIWELCDGATEVEEMVEAICSLFTVVPDQVRSDVERVLADMHRAGVVS